MKKFFCFLLIIIAAGTVFFLGWAQLTVPPGSYGVMRSKTHGVDPRLIREGEFRWVWYKLIPTNVGITIFTPRHVERSICLAGTLPLGDAYGTMVGLDTDFSYEITGSFSFAIRPDALPALAGERNITDQAGLELFERDLAEEIEKFILDRLRSYAEEGKNPADFPGQDASGSLEEEVLGAFPRIGNFSCTMRTVRFPDFALYDMAKSIYTDYLEQQRGLLRTDISVSAGRHLDTQFRFDELEKYGELLAKYPVLLQYLALEKGLPGGRE